MDADGVLTLARCLRKCKSTPDLSFTAVSILSKTLTARATRLESTASRARLAAEKEAYMRMIAAKRRRALGPKNKSDFMRQTIRDRERERENNRAKAKIRSVHSRLQAETKHKSPSKDLSEPPRWGSSDVVLALPLREITHSHRSNSVRSSRSSHRSSENHGQETTSTSRKERNFPRPWSANQGPDRLSLEDDDDIRVLLDRALSDTSSIGTAGLPRPATSGDGRSGKTRLNASHPFSRSLVKVEAPPAQGSSCCKRLVRRPHTAGAGGRARSLERKTNPSDVLQLRREMLIRSHGEGCNRHLFPSEPFEATAMGRKACCADPGGRTELTPWMPANTVRDLEKRSRMLMNQRPVVSKYRSWT